MKVSYSSIKIKRVLICKKCKEEIIKMCMRCIEKIKPNVKIYCSGTGIHVCKKCGERIVNNLEVNNKKKRGKK